MASVDFFLKIDGIQGESPDDKHKNEIQLESWSFGATQSGSFAMGGGGGAGKVQMQDFHFVKQVDKAGPKLLLACATGEHISKVVLVCRKAGKDQQEYMKITLSDCLVSSYHTSGSGGSDAVPLEEVSINFAKIEHEYREQKADGTLGGTTKAEFDLKKMKASA
jgi:type VI secretion system secreted protein Hcp